MSILSELKKLTGKNNATVISQALPDSMSGGNNDGAINDNNHIITFIDTINNVPDYIIAYLAALAGVDPSEVNFMYCCKASIDAETLISGFSNGEAFYVDLYGYSGLLYTDTHDVYLINRFRLEDEGRCIQLYCRSEYETDHPICLYIINGELWSFEA